MSATEPCAKFSAVELMCSVGRDVAAEVERYFTSSSSSSSMYTTAACCTPIPVDCGKADELEDEWEADRNDAFRGEIVSFG